MNNFDKDDRLAIIARQWRNEVEDNALLKGGRLMKIGIIDADLIGKKKHYFPNLVCMKLSAWHKKKR